MSPTRYTADEFRAGAVIHEMYPCLTYGVKWMLQQAADTEAGLVKLTERLPQDFTTPEVSEIQDLLRELGLERSR